MKRNNNTKIELLNVQLCNWIYDVVAARKSSDDSLADLSIRFLAKIHGVSTALHESEHPIAKTSIVRALIEIVADMFEIHRNNDRNIIAYRYSRHQYESYKSLHELVNKSLHDNKFNPRKRIFDNQNQNWTETSLMGRVKKIDTTGDALSDYDLFSHYVHIGGSGSTHLLDNGINEISYRSANYMIIFSVIMIAEYGLLTKAEYYQFSVLCKGMIMEAIQYGNFGSKPSAHFSDSDEAWSYPELEQGEH